MVARAPDLFNLQVAAPMGEDVGDGRLTRTPADDQVRVALQQDALVAHGQAATSHHHRGLFAAGYLVQ